jgi:homoserine kinase type II
MAVFTEISDEDRNSIAAGYGMTSLSSMTGIADGDRSGVANFRLRHDDVLFSEIAGVLVSWADLPKGELHEQKARAVLAGYESVRHLTDAESVAIPAFVLASARRYAGEKNKTRLLQVKVRAFESTTFAAAARQAECRPA